MGKVLVIGAGGKVGKQLVSALVKLGTPVVAMVRSANEHTFERGVELVEGDLEDNIEPIFGGHHSVIFSAGSGANTGLDKTLLVDLWGACKAIDAAKKAMLNIL